MALPIGGYDYPHGVSLWPFTSPYLNGYKKQFNKLLFVLSYIYMNFKVSFIALFIALIAFVGVPREVYAYTNCIAYNSSTNPNPTLPCSIGAYDYDSMAVEAGVNSFVYNYDKMVLVDNTTSWQLLKDTDWVVQDSQLWISGAWHTEYDTLSFAKSSALFFGVGANPPEPSIFFISSNLLLYDEESTIYYPDCSSDSDVTQTTCASEFLYEGFILESEWTSLQDEYQIEFYVLDLDGNIYEPSQFYSGVFFGTSSVGEYADTFDFPIQDATSSILVKICINDRYSSALAYWGQEMTARCSNIFFGNGMATTTLSSFITGIPNTDGDSVTNWYDMDCEEIGILDIKKGVQCGLLWAFKPSSESLDKFNQAKTSVLTTYPIGYATLILTDVTSAFNSTSTVAFDRDIDVKKFFGQSGGTTTISVSALTSKMGMVQPIIDYFNVIMWTLFVAWLLWWGLTRKL